MEQLRKEIDELNWESTRSWERQENGQYTERQLKVRKCGHIITGLGFFFYPYVLWFSSTKINPTLVVVCNFLVCLCVFVPCRSLVATTSALQALEKDLKAAKWMQSILSLYHPNVNICFTVSPCLCIYLFKKIKYWLFLPTAISGEQFFWEGLYLGVWPRCYCSVTIRGKMLLRSQRIFWIGSLCHFHPLF